MQGTALVGPVGQVHWVEVTLANQPVQASGFRRIPDATRCFRHGMEVRSDPPNVSADFTLFDESRLALPGRRTGKLTSSAWG